MQKAWKWDWGGQENKFITAILDKSILPCRTLDANCTPAWTSARRPERKLKFLQWNTTTNSKKTRCKATSDSTLHSNVVTQNAQQEAAKIWKCTSNVHAIPEQ